MGTELDRPLVLDEARCRAIIECLVEGNRLGIALKFAGVSYDTFYHWERRYKDNDPTVPQVIVDFFNKVKSAEAASEIFALRSVRSGRQGWQADAWFLERRYPQRWGKQDRATIPPPPKKYSEMTDEELESYRRRVASKARGDRD